MGRLRHIRTRLAGLIAPGHPGQATGGPERELVDAERNARDIEAKLQAILENSSAIIFVKDLAGRYTLVNRRFEELFGLAPGEAIGKTAYDFIGMDAGKPVQANDLRVLEGGAPIQAEEVVELEDGCHTFLSVKFPLRDPVDGTVYGLGGMSTDITDRTRAEQAAEAAMREAESANDAKSRFLSRMSHELRTPLNAILGFGQLLDMEDLGEPNRDNVEQILKGGRHLLRLINEVLEISRIETGEMPMSIEPVDAHLALSGVAELLSPLAAERTLHMEVVAHDTAHFVLADYQRLRQVLLNLVSNAIKYNRTGGSISLSTHATGDDRMRIAVADTGPGIAPRHLTRLFTPFDRLDADPEVEGTGLGLALSKRLVEAMNGTIAVDSRVGRGTTFTVELAAAQAPADHGHEEPAVRTPSRNEAPDGPRRTVLCVEDNVSNVKLLERIFSAVVDVELLVAVQGSLALELARLQQPDLILMDLNLPDMSGEDLLEHLREHEVTKDIPVVVLSADATPRQVERMSELGVRDYVTKPYNVKDLLEVVADSFNAAPI